MYFFKTYLEHILETILILKQEVPMCALLPHFMRDFKVIFSIQASVVHDIINLTHKQLFLTHFKNNSYLLCFIKLQFNMSNDYHIFIH